MVGCPSTDDDDIYDDEHGGDGGISLVCQHISFGVPLNVAQAVAGCRCGNIWRFLRNRGNVDDDHDDSVGDGGDGGDGRGVVSCQIKVLSFATFLEKQGQHWQC